MSESVSVGDLNSTAKGSGARKSAGKVDWSLVPFHLLAGVARVLMSGTIKYASWNWAKGMPWSECFRCTCSHLFKFWFLRQELDDETQEHHLDHAICNLLFLRHYTLAYKEGDNRPPEYADFASAIEWFNQRFDAEAFKKRTGFVEQKEPDSKPALEAIAEFTAMDQQLIDPEDYM